METALVFPISPQTINSQLQYQLWPDQASGRANTERKWIWLRRMDLQSGWVE